MNSSCRGAAAPPATLLLVSLLAAATATPAVADAWTGFRGGAERDGISHATGLTRSWREEGPAVLWKRPIGEGFSGLAVAGETVCTQWAADGQEILGCFAVADGDELWRLPLGETFVEMFGNGPRATPSIEGETVYGLGARGRLVAAGIADGEPLWQLELLERYPITEAQTLTPMGSTPPGLQLPMYGYASSPLVVDDLLVVMTGAGKGRSLVALDKTTGEERWTALDDEVSYSSPALMTLAGERQIVQLAGSDVVGLSPGGDVLWRQNWAAAPAQPLFVAPDGVFVSTVNDVGADLYRVRTGDGDRAVDHAWHSPRLKNSWNSSLVLGGLVYGFDNATLRCLDAATGAVRWARRGLGQGSLLAADGLLLILSDRGKLYLTTADGDGLEVLAEAQILEGSRTWTAPALADGILYARNHGEMTAVDLRRGERR